MSPRAHPGLQDYSSPNCVGVATDHAGTTYADGSAFNGEYLLDKCYGLTYTYNGTAETTYYFETYDPALDAVTWSAYNKSDCTPDVAGAKVQSSIEWCGACQSSNSTSWKVTGCPTPVVKRPPTSIKPGTAVSVVSFSYYYLDDDDQTRRPDDPPYPPLARISSSFIRLSSFILRNHKRTESYHY